MRRRGRGRTGHAEEREEHEQPPEPGRWEASVNEAAQEVEEVDGSREVQALLGPLDHRYKEDGTVRTYMQRMESIHVRKRF